MAKEKINTRKDEVRYVTDDPKKMLGKWLPNDILQKWTEDFLDEDTGEVVTIERSQKLFERGTYIDQEVLAQIQFHIQAGAIKEVEVSNQKRIAFERQNTSLSPWTAQAEIGDRKHKFLLYASNIANVIDILNDYIELNYTEGFSIVNIKEMDSCIILTDNFSKKKVDMDMAYLKGEIGTSEYAEHIDSESEESGDILQKKFYQLDVKITYENDVETTQTFIVHTPDTERALMVISQYLKKLEEDRKKVHEKNGWSEYEVRDFKLCIEKAAPIPVGAFIPKDFTMAYNE